MAKSLTLGNGNLLICYDKFGQVDELYYPYVGQENHLAGHYVHKIGIYVDGQIYWLDNPTWQIKIDYAEATLAADITAISHELNLELKFLDVVYNEQTAYIRKLLVTNKADYQRELKVYFNHQFEIYESNRGDNAYYDPSLNVIVHYKGRRVFMINAMVDNHTFDDYCVGLFGIEGREGTFKDAEDGHLSKNPIEHGLVDSVIGLYTTVQPQETKTIYYWMAIGKDVEECQDLNKYIINRTPDYLIETTMDYWNAWVNMQEFNFHGLNADVIRLFRNSLLVIRTHVDNRGGIIASSDSDLLKHGRDTYSYMWPRDGGIIAMALSKAGYFNIADNFFDFCNEIITEGGYVLHKYRVDRSLGSSWHAWIHNGKARLPIQEDETALILISLWEYYKSSKDLEFIEQIYNSVIKKAASFLIGYRYPELKLPQPSYDLWEERYGISTFTAASVYGALKAASRFAEVLGKETRYNEYNTVAEEIKTGIMEHLYDAESGNFYKLINYENGIKTPDTTVDMSGVYGIFKYGVLDITDERLTKAMDNALQRLECKTDVKGIARYEGDYYFRVSNDVPGNPWIITTLWLAQYYIAKAENDQELEKAKEILQWCVNSAATSGILPEQLHPYTREHLSATPLTWSHAEYVITVLDLIAKLKQFGVTSIASEVA